VTPKEDNIKIHNGLKKKCDAFSPLLFNFALEYAILKIKEDKKGLILNGLNQALVYADDADLIKEDLEALKSNTDVLVEACGLQVYRWT